MTAVVAEETGRQAVGPLGTGLWGAALWGTGQRTMLGVGWTLGVVAVVLGWWGTAGEAVVGDQYRWVSLAAVGLVLSGAVSAAWLMAGRRAVGVRCRHTVPVPEEGDRAPVVDLRPLPAASAAVGQNGSRPVSADGMRYFHRPDCPLARGKAVAGAERAEHEQLGRTACEVCVP